jgi:S-adenosyl methyltransferase
MSGPEDMKGDKMTASDEAADDGGAGEAGAPPFDTSVAHQARVYDYLLGGKDNYAADRAAATAYLKIDPDLSFSARAISTRSGSGISRASPAA